MACRFWESMQVRKQCWRSMTLWPQSNQAPQMRAARPLVSVVIVTYKRLKLLTETVSSGPDQTARELRLREFAAEGVHQAAAQAPQQYISPPARVVELGAGAGAFSHRLRALGYMVTASDVDPHNSTPPACLSCVVISIESGRKGCKGAARTHCAPSR